ncbi:hypothetical protein EFBL_0086 [Effusibacillus lacus]|uniref:TVP38/TMEM64 family membrane protein n=1 Tax=Effusibacillus lacus TaxID=1348429 RepID=A0A292YF62_9BACL|nr:putative membrane protein YdjX (TVP38/TMEM64 family) [Effusibacillus lacus]GAX88477.1 hypothetical protein EFBL_0086 [Effusibacillus lacus]
MVKKLFTIFTFIAIIAVGYWQKDLFLGLIRAGGSLSIAVSIVFVAITAFFPVVPFVIVAGVVGGVFGAMMGTAITLAGAIFGAMVMFLMSRFGFRDWAQVQLAKYPKVKEYESIFEKNAFASILFVRLVPVVPSQAVNILSGVSLVSWFTFLLATTLGKLPANLVFNLAGSTLSENKMMSFLIFGTYFLVITVAAFLYMRKRQLQQELQQEES